MIQCVIIQSRFIGELAFYDIVIITSDSINMRLSILFSESLVLESKFLIINDILRREFGSKLCSVEKLIHLCHLLRSMTHITIYSEIKIAYQKLRYYFNITIKFFTNPSRSDSCIASWNNIIYCISRTVDISREFHLLKSAELFVGLYLT